MYPFVGGYSKGLPEERKKRFNQAYELIRVKPEEAVQVFKSGKIVDEAYVSHGITPLDPNDMAVYIRNIGVEHCLMSTDSGIFSVPIPEESMRTFIALLLDAGIKEEEIDIMVKKNPANLLNLN